MRRVYNRTRHTRNTSVVRCKALKQATPMMFSAALQGLTVTASENRGAATYDNQFIATMTGLTNTRPESASAELPPVPLTLEGASVLHQMMRVRWPAWKALADAQRRPAR